MHTVETKNFVAVFVLSARADGLGVTDRDGGKNTVDTLMKLDRIILYSKTDLLQNHASAVPIKTVHFEYDYSLCKNVENNSGATIIVNGTNINANKGKLTLKKIYFTYGNSNKGMYTSYRFSYADPNPNYNIKGYDRWGNYAKLQTGTSDIPNNAEWPFTTQTKIDADSSASSWNLNKIELPTGGVINVTYESDDYAYVQEKQAQMMVKIEDFGNSSSDYQTSQTIANLYEEGKNKNNNYVFFKIPVTAHSISVDKYFKGVDSLYFNLRSVIRDKGSPEEDIDGFCTVVRDGSNNPECGTVSGHSEIGWVHVQEVSIRDKDQANSQQQLQPMAKQAMTWAIQNVPEQVYPGSNPNATGESALKGLVTAFSEISSLVQSCYKMLRNRDYCKKVILGKSYIRINCASKFKLGGGNRVKKIELDDKWADMKNSSSSNAASSSYGQEYHYTTLEGTDTISSGVAQWEPSIGGCENPYRLPNWEIHKRVGGRDERILHMEPVAEALYPSPSVGYSNVIVKSLGGKMGRTETSYYTAKDFPTQVYKTDLDKNSSDNPFFKGANQAANMGIKAGSDALKGSSKSGLGLDVSYNFLNVQQGYVIINNDMHGKMKEQHIYPEGSNTARSSVKYKYKTDKKDKKKLDNKVLTYDNETDTVAEQTIALDYDISYDKQAEQTIAGSAKLQFNLDQFFVAAIPTPAISFWLGLGFNMNDFKYNVVTKQINQYGILESTEVFEDGSTINTKNLLYDSHTGEVLLTQTQNEFNDSIFNLTYPAHFAYDDGMGQAYKNINVILNSVKVGANGALSMPHSYENWKIKKYLVPGDEVTMTQGGSSYKAWVYHLRNNDLCLIAQDGNIYTNAFYNNLDIQVIRSGRRNMQNLPIGGLTLLTNPLVYSGGAWRLVINSQKVLNVSAVTFSDEWQTFCANETKKICSKETNAGRGIKLWLYNIAKDSTMTNSKTYSETDIPQLFKDLKFCDTARQASTNYVVNQTSVASTGHITYIPRNSSHDTCCTISLGCDYINCSTYSVPRYVIMFPSNHTYYKYEGVDSVINSLEPYLTFNHSSINDSIVYGDTCIFRADTMACFANHPYVYSIFYVSKEVYDNIDPFVGDAKNYLYKKEIFEDSTHCEFIRYDYINSTSLFPVSMDTSTFQISTNTNTFKIVATLNNGKKVLLTGSLECQLPLFEDCCDNCQPPDAHIINPYMEGVRGVWRKKADYAYHAKRKLTTESSVAKPKIRQDGVFDTYYPFWDYSSLAKSYVQTTGTNWQKANEVTAYNPYGNEIENKDALGIYSAALFAYNYRLPIAVAKNAKYTQLAYDGFEDYGLLAYSGCPKSHWSFEFDMLNGAALNDTFSHSGKYSLKVPINHSEMIARRIVNCTNANNGTESDQYILEACNCIKKFSPDTGDYLIGGWLRERHGAMQGVTDSFNHASIMVVFKKGCNSTDSIDTVFYADGPIIEGWQRVEGKFHVPNGYPIVEVYLNAQGFDAYFDDLRIHPWLGNMKTYAYDQVSLRLMAELDENNFATFYEYDQEGQLMRVKKETVKGIVTLKEVRSHSSDR